MSSRIEIVSRVSGRRRWTVEQKLAVLRDAFGPEGCVRAACERHDVGSGSIYTWRRQAMSGELAGVRKLAEPAFAEVQISEQPALPAPTVAAVGGTVVEAFVTRARLAVGETVLIHGGAGGVGTIAIQVAKAIGARVLTTARAADHAFVRSLGADEAIDHGTEDYVGAATRLTGSRGVDVVFDAIGGDTLTRSPLALADMGRVVSMRARPEACDPCARPASRCPSRRHRDRRHRRFHRSTWRA